MGIISRLREEFKLLNYVLMPENESEYSLYLYWVNKINPMKHWAAMKSAAREKRSIYAVKLREVITTGSDGKTIWMPLLLIKYYGTIRRVFINVQSIGKVKRINRVYITNLSFEHNIFTRNELKGLETGLNRILDNCWEKYPDIEWTPEEFENALIRIAVTSNPEDYWKMKA
ncbi:hypothetical protein [Kosmotoga pacifica]|uniref:Uncharacterized protein n=1 Tax=Kosmotoga pacifica TaxID=1330330 RepID=A0A0G2Z8C2_9BACT|nr:hypothetical protein [Kosmotoga pacifica]AKI97817.1 hypothetical protein IX53_08345 [Kosmotoga pacifica]